MHLLTKVLFSTKKIISKLLPFGFYRRIRDLLNLLSIPYREDFGCVVTYILYFIPYGERLDVGSFTKTFLPAGSWFSVFGGQPN
jgi:hypothetical protein